MWRLAGATGDRGGRGERGEPTEDDTLRLEWFRLTAPSAASPSPLLLPTLFLVRVAWPSALGSAVVMGAAALKIGLFLYCLCPP